MNDSFAWWLVIAGIAVGVALAWLVLGRLPREESDISVGERGAEAAWISRSIAGYGGDAPEPLIEEILDLHRDYLEGRPADLADRQTGQEEDEYLRDETDALEEVTPYPADEGQRAGGRA